MYDSSILILPCIKYVVLNYRERSLVKGLRCIYDAQCLNSVRNLDNIKNDQTWCSSLLPLSKIISSFSFLNRIKYKKLSNEIYKFKNYSIGFENFIKTYFYLGIALDSNALWKRFLIDEAGHLLVSHKPGFHGSHGSRIQTLSIVDSKGYISTISIPEKTDYQDWFLMIY